MTVLVDSTCCPECVGKTFIVAVIARNQSFPCGGCHYRKNAMTCSRPCNPSWFNRPFTNFKRVKDGEIVKDTDGNLFMCHAKSKTTMALTPQKKGV